MQIIFVLLPGCLMLPHGCIFLLKNPYHSVFSKIIKFPRKFWNNYDNFLRKMQKGNRKIGQHCEKINSLLNKSLSFSHIAPILSIRKIYTHDATIQKQCINWMFIYSLTHLSHLYKVDTKSFFIPTQSCLCSMDTKP